MVTGTLPSAHEVIFGSQGLLEDEIVRLQREITSAYAQLEVARRHNEELARQLRTAHQQAAAAERDRIRQAAADRQRAEWERSRLEVIERQRAEQAQRAVREEMEAQARRDGEDPIDLGRRRTDRADSGPNPYVFDDDDDMGQAFDDFINHADPDLDRIRSFLLGDRA